jgi:hypothetical protein
MAAAQVYVKELERRKYGYPLYDPEAQINPGDVGFFEHDSGDFCWLFNVFLEESHPTHARDGVPAGFVPLSKHGLRFRSKRLPAQPIITKKVLV